MDAWRRHNRGQGEYGAPFRSVFSVKISDNCMCKFCGKTVYHEAHFEICTAKRSFCYHCRQFGHYARMCRFHGNPPTKKVKSKSKLRRDAERLKQFKERKSMREFPCYELNNIELHEFCPGVDYRSEEIKKLKFKNERLHSANVKNMMRADHYERKFKEIVDKHKTVSAELTDITKEREKDKQYIEDLKEEMMDYQLQIEVHVCKSDNKNTKELQSLKTKITDLETEIKNLQTSEERLKTSNEQKMYLLRKSDYFREQEELDCDFWQDLFMKLLNKYHHGSMGIFNRLSREWEREHPERAKFIKNGRPNPDWMTW